MTSINPNITIIAGVAASTSGLDPKKAQRKDSPRSVAHFGSEYRRIIEKALNEEPANHAEIVKDARELLLSGHFDSPQTARQAAERIIEEGI